MFRKLTLSILLTVCICLTGKFAYSITYTISGASNTNYTLNAGDTLYITASGNYTGQVSGLTANNRVIIVASGGIFEPNTLNPTNGVVCKMQIYGTFRYSQPLTTNTDFTIDIYAGGIVNLAAMNTKGKNQTWTNNVGGYLSFSGDVLINGGTASDDNNNFYNYETIVANGNFQMNSGSSFINYKDFTMTNSASTFKLYGGSYENHGQTDIAGDIFLNSGASTIKNYCRLISSGNIAVSNGNFTNYNYMWSRYGDIILSTGGSINNIPMLGGSYTIMHGKSFRQTGGILNGNVNMWFYNGTRVSGGTIGAISPTTDTVKMYDLTKTGAIFDTTGGTINSNTIYNAWGTPDSTRAYLAGCSMETFMEVPLAINWIDFTVALSNSVPALAWSAEYTEGTVFEIQRSYDGRNFTGIKNVPYESNRSDYSYNDNSVDAGSTFAYYRIRAIELGGTEKYTSVRVVRFASKTGTIHLSPNPFKNNFIISYTSDKKANIVVKIFNMSGQQKLAKTITANEGENRIDITEAANLASGIYIVQVSNGSSIISSGKIIKQ